MTREWRIVAIVGGVLFCTLAFFAVAVVVSLQHAASQIRSTTFDVRTAVRNANKIATFDVPRGYRYERSTDAFVETQVTLAPSDPRREPHSTIVLAGLDARFMIGTAGDQTGLVVRALRRETERAVGCAPFHIVHYRRIATKRWPVTLRTFRCAFDAVDFEMELAPIPGNMPNAAVVVFGPTRSFDRAAADALVRSLR